MMETRTCKVCGRELPETNFPMGRWGRVNTCKECRAAALRETKAAKRARMGGANRPPFSDPDFDGQAPGEVWRMMCRAKKWLESRGFSITLAGEYRETKIRKLRIE